MKKFLIIFLSILTLGICSVSFISKIGMADAYIVSEVIDDYNVVLNGVVILNKNDLVLVPDVKVNAYFKSDEKIIAKLSGTQYLYNIDETFYILVPISNRSQYIGI